MTNQTTKIVGNSSTDGWYWVLHGTNELWENYLKSTKEYPGTGHWVEHYRTGGWGGLSRIHNCLTDMCRAAVSIASATGMTMTREVNYDLMWSYTTTPPVMKITLHVPGDSTNERDMTIEALCNTFIPRRLKKKEMKLEAKECAP